MITYLLINAKSALLFGASTPAGANLGSLIRSGLSSPSHLMEYGGFETMSSNGSSSQCCGFVRVSSHSISNLSKSISCKNILIRQRLYVVIFISCPKNPLITESFKKSVWLVLRLTVYSSSFYLFVNSL